MTRLDAIKKCLFWRAQSRRSNTVKNYCLAQYDRYRFYALLIRQGADPVAVEASIKDYLI